jgi:2-oxoisovalerate dehydrogenase E1 component
LVFGEDVGRKGGVYGVTVGLQKRFGPARVFDTLLDETSILGIAQGAAHIGLLPVPEIQYLAYIHNALDQLRGEAASLQFFSSGQFRNPMVVRVAGLAYQKGFGGHFHNDNSVGALRDIPGLVLAVPARGDDAARMLRGAIAMAAEDGRVVVFLEPIALYHERDLHTDGDGGWLAAYPPPPEVLLPGEVGIHGQADGTADVLLVSYANGLRLSLQAAKRLSEDHGLKPRVVDLRWLNPLPLEAVREHASEVGAVVVVDECRATGGGVADAIVADLAEHAIGSGLSSVRAVDSFVPLGPAAAAVLVGVDQIVAAGVAAAGRRRAAAARS